MDSEGNVLKAIEDEIYGIKTIKLSNGLLSIDVLAGKGGDISQITYLPLSLPILWQEKDNFKLYENRDLSKERLPFYNEMNTGGWQDVVPGLGKYGEVELKGRPVGIAATVPWSYMILKPGEESVSIMLEVKLPVMPLKLTKIYTLKKGDASLYIEETIENEGDRQAQITWTQHPIFGGDFLEGTVNINWPGDEIFIPSAYSKSGAREEDYTMPIDRVTMPDGTVHDLRKMRQRTDDGHLVFAQKLLRDYFELFNKSKGVGIRLAWDKEVFPYLKSWYQNTAKGYSIGLEPCSYYYQTLEECLKDGSLLNLKAGECRTAKLKLDFLLNNY